MFTPRVLFLLLLLYATFVNAIIAKNDENRKKLEVYKCCKADQIYIGQYCKTVNKTDQYHPIFTSDKGETNLQVEYTLVPGLPNCGHMQVWSIHHSQDSADRLRLLPNGILRHYIDQQIPNEDFEAESNDGVISLHHDYEPGKYCLDKKIKDNIESQFALVCYPHVQKEWKTSELINNIVSPITHGISMMCLLIVAVIYFIIPTMRDLTGNIITTLCMCLIVSQTGDVVRLLTVFKNHTNIFIAETICYISLLGAFFWLNSLGYHIWKSFRSRNVFLRITDGKKYCYYCLYVWSCTLVLGVLAVFAHFALDYEEGNQVKKIDEDQEQIGSLGIIVFFVPVAFTVLMDVFFFATTLKRMNKMHTYGRIHHKLRHSFRMFFLLLLVMTFSWLFLLASFSRYEGLVHTHIIVNAFQGPLIFYICILNQKHVTYLLRKTCCDANCICTCCRPEPECDWGDEMTAMNTGSY